MATKYELDIVELDGLLIDLTRLLQAAAIMIDDFADEGPTTPRGIINAAMDKIDEFEGLLTKRLEQAEGSEIDA